jgi:hypothetical protein
MSASEEIDAMATRLDVLSPTLPTLKAQSDARELAATLRQFAREHASECGDSTLAAARDRALDLRRARVAAIAFQPFGDRYDLHALSTYPPVAVPAAKPAVLPADDAVFVGAPLGVGSYLKGFRAEDCKTHVFEIRDNRPLRVLCGKVALSSYYEDTTQHVAPADVSCRSCASRFKKLSSSKE